MDRYGYGSGQRSYCGGHDRRLEIVSGKGFGTKAAATLPPPSPSRASQCGTSSSSSKKPWGFSDPEMKRKKRIAKYKVYTVEGNLKASLKNGLRWIKVKCSQIIHGYR